MAMEKKLSIKHNEVAKISPFYLELLLMIGYTSQQVLIKKIVVWIIGLLKISVSQNCNICASAHNGLKAC